MRPGSLHVALTDSKVLQLHQQASQGPGVLPTVTLKSLQAFGVYRDFKGLGFMGRFRVEGLGF